MKAKRRRYIDADELTRLSFCNAKSMPQAVNDDGVRKEWTGIGWLSVGKPSGREPIVRRHAVRRR